MKGLKTTVGNGHVMEATKIGNLLVKMCDRNGKEVADALLKEVQMLKRSPFNLLSITKLLKLGFKMSGDYNSITFMRENFRLVCDIVVQPNHGMLFTVKLKPRQNEIAAATIIRLPLLEAHC